MRESKDTMAEVRVIEARMRTACSSVSEAVVKALVEATPICARPAATA